MKLIVDPATGMSGDMFIAALLDAGVRPGDRPEFAARVEEVMRFAGGLLGKAEVKAKKIGRGATEGTRLAVQLEKNERSVPAGRMSEMLETVTREFDFSHGEREFAERAFAILRRAEEEAHREIEGRDGRHRPGSGRAPSGEAHLHEAQDILLDVAGSARALGLLHVDLRDVVCLTPVFYGGGTVTFSHGTLPVPAPAVKIILKTHRIPSQPGPVPHELLTPTGASLLAALRPRFRPRAETALHLSPAAMRGVGLGTLEFEDPDVPVNGLVVHLRDD